MDEKIYVVVHVAVLRNCDFELHGAFSDKELARKRLNDVVKQEQSNSLSGRKHEWYFSSADCWHSTSGETIFIDETTLNK